jgi:hypothetical protein
MMMPDVNVLVAASDRDHLFHSRAKIWLKTNAPIATCALTELGMVRILIQLGSSIKDAEDQLAFLVANFRGAFIACDLSVENLIGTIKGHRQLTDRYLIELCAKHSLQLATFDKSISGAQFIA